MFFGIWFSLALDILNFKLINFWHNILIYNVTKRCEIDKKQKIY